MLGVLVASASLIGGTLVLRPRHDAVTFEQHRAIELFSIGRSLRKPGKVARKCDTCVVFIEFRPSNELIGGGC